jgi:hypothetical protein
MEIRISNMVVKKSPFVVQSIIITKLTSPFRSGTSLEIIPLLYLFRLLDTFPSSLIDSNVNLR